MFVVGARPSFGFANTCCSFGSKLYAQCKYMFCKKLTCKYVFFCFDHVQFFDFVYGSLCVQMHVYAIHASACAVLLPSYNCLCMMHAMYHNAIVQCML